MFDHTALFEGVYILAHYVFILHFRGPLGRFVSFRYVESSQFGLTLSILERYCCVFPHSISMDEAPFRRSRSNPSYTYLIPGIRRPRKHHKTAKCHQGRQR